MEFLRWASHQKCRSSHRDSWTSKPYNSSKKPPSFQLPSSASTKRSRQTLRLHRHLRQRDWTKPRRCKIFFKIKSMKLSPPPHQRSREDFHQGRCPQGRFSTTTTFPPVSGTPCSSSQDFHRIVTDRHITCINNRLPLILEKEKTVSVA